MTDICRLCCSDKFVNNDIFDDDSALYLKMSLYLPIKVFKNDRLPQKICDKCSCKVNDFYQFCNAAIEVQNRLHAILMLTPNTVLDTVDLTGIKRNESPVPYKCEQSTQTEDEPSLTNKANETAEVKKEPVSSPNPPQEEEVKLELDHFDDHHSDSSDDLCLLVLKNKKRTKTDVNGVESYSPKKKTKHKQFDDLLASVPDDTALRVLADNVKLEEKEDSDEMEAPGEVNAKGRMDLLKEVDTYKCCVCLAECYTKADMLKHYRQHEEQCRSSLQPPAVPPPPDQQPLRCPRCRKVLSGGVGEWEAHWVRHWARDRKPLRCALCERSFADANSAFKHGLTHNCEEGDDRKDKQPNKRFVCDMCPQSFVYMRFLLAHRTREHPAEAARPLALRCGECAREFAHLNSLRRHIRAHTGERNYLCNVCGKALTSREHLKFHIRIHTGYKPNVCKTCGKGFVKKCNLTLHERVHSGEKPHVCSHCGKAFSQRSTLVIHERYHSGARPYVCGLCGRGFVAKGLLSMHLKTTCI